MKMLVYSFPLTCEFVVLSVEHCRESEAHELLDTYETGKKKYHMEENSVYGLGKENNEADDN